MYFCLKKEMESFKSRFNLLIVIFLVAFMVSFAILASNAELKTTLASHHILKIVWLTMGIIFLGLLFVRKHAKDSGIIMVFGSLLVVAELVFADVYSSWALLASAIIMAFSGLGFIFLANKQQGKTGQ